MRTNHPDEEHEEHHEEEVVADEAGGEHHDALNLNENVNQPENIENPENQNNDNLNHEEGVVVHNDGNAPEVPQVPPQPENLQQLHVPIDENNAHVDGNVPAAEGEQNPPEQNADAVFPFNPNNQNGPEDDPINMDEALQHPANQEQVQQVDGGLEQPQAQVDNQAEQLAQEENADADNAQEDYEPQDYEPYENFDVPHQNVVNVVYDLDALEDGLHIYEYVDAHGRVCIHPFIRYAVPDGGKPYPVANRVAIPFAPGANIFYGNCVLVDWEAPASLFEIIDEPKDFIVRDDRGHANPNHEPIRTVETYYSKFGFIKKYRRIMPKTMADQVESKFSPWKDALSLIFEIQQAAIAGFYRIPLAVNVPHSPLIDEPNEAELIAAESLFRDVFFRSSPPQDEYLRQIS